jgi:hypothetical protein
MILVVAYGQGYFVGKVSLNIYSTTTLLNIPNKKPIKFQPSPGYAPDKIMKRQALCDHKKTCITG